MMWKTHLMWGALCGFLYITFIQSNYFVTNEALNIIVFALILFGSLLPDIDHQKSKFGRRVKIIGLLFEHRGFFHSIFAIIMWWFLFGLFLKPIYVIAILFGYITHLFIDSFNNYGISPFAPLIKYKIKGPIMTNGMIEKVLYIVLICLNLAFLIHYFI